VAEVSGTSAGSGVAEKAGAAAMRLATIVPTAVNTKRSFNDLIT
jgi:hypothetical protein